MKTKRRDPALRMDAAAFDETMRRVFQVAPPSPKKVKVVRQKKGGKKA